MDKGISISYPIVGRLTIASGIIALVSYFLVAAGFNFHFELFSNPSQVFDTEGIHSGMLKWSMITDILGYYLLLLPLLFYLHQKMVKSFAWSNITNLCGIAYILIGSIGAAILAVLWPMHIEQFSSLSASQQEISRIVFSSLTSIVVDGLWNLLDSLLSGIWFLGIGLFLYQSKTKFLGWLTIALSIVCLLDFLGHVLAIQAIAEAALNIYLVFAPVWAIIVGINIKKT
jgi:hypothetical protein